MDYQKCGLYLAIFPTGEKTKDIFSSAQILWILQFPSFAIFLVGWQFTIYLYIHSFVISLFHHNCIKTLGNSQH